MSQTPGFDPKTFDPIKHLLKAPPRADPWMRAEAWRYHGIYSRANRFKNAFPGFGIAAGAFTVYCVVEHFFFKDDHGHHAPAGGHGEGHH